MHKPIHQAAAIIGTAAIGAILLTGPALASQPLPNDGGNAVGGTTARAAEVRADRGDLRQQAATIAPRNPTSPTPSDLPYLQIGLATVAVATFAAGAVGLGHRHHGVQPA